MTKTKSKSIIFALLIAVLILTSFILVGCGDNVITNVKSLNGIVDSIQVSTNGENINSITIIYLAQPSSMKAIYNESELEVEPIIIEDYYNDSSNVNAYSYTYTVDNKTSEEYNLSPITINCTIDNNKYKFNLTTNLIELIYPELVEDNI